MTEELLREELKEGSERKGEKVEEKTNRYSKCEEGDKK